MSERDHEELIHREVDGRLAPQEAARLEELVAADPGLRVEREAAREVARMLAGVPREEPPPGLIADVMRSVRALPRAATRRRPAAGTLFGAGRPATLRYALAFAAGLAFGAVSGALVSRSSLRPALDGSELAATMLPDEARKGVPVDRTTVAIEGLRGEVTTTLAGSRVVAEIHLESSQPVDVSVDFDPKVLWPVGIERSQAPGGGQVTLGADRLDLVQAGTGRYKLVLGVNRPETSPLRVKFSLGDRRVERTLETRRPNS